MKWGLTRAQGWALALVVLLCLAGLTAGVRLLFAAPPELVGSALLPTAASQAADLPALAPTATQTEDAQPAQPLEPGTSTPPPPTSALDPAACIPATAERQAVERVDVAAPAAAPGAVITVGLDGQTVAASLIGVDPAGSAEAFQTLLRELTAAGPLWLVADGADRDAQGQLRRYLLAGEGFVNYELIRRGAALPALFPPGFACSETFLAGERLARAEGQGYWGLRPALPTLAPAATAAGLACDCAVTYQCADFQTRSAAQACYNACGDYRNTTLDPDHNGLACEQIP